MDITNIEWEGSIIENELFVQGLYKRSHKISCRKARQRISLFTEIIPKIHDN